MSNTVIQVLFGDFIREAEKFGLPVGFLRKVKDGYTFEEEPESGIDAAKPNLNQMWLKRSTVDQVQHMSFSKPVGEASGILTIYHESTHGWFDLMDADAEVKSLIATGDTYYANSPLEDGSAATDPGRIFQEAAASYVGHRAATWWTTMEGLTIVLDSASGQMDQRQKDFAIRRAKEAKSDYNKEMAKRVFGYQEVGTWPWSKTQVETKRSIFSSLKEYCDRVILESKIPDQFQMNQKAVELWKEVVKKLPEVER